MYQTNTVTHDFSLVKILMAITSVCNNKTEDYMLLRETFKTTLIFSNRVKIYEPKRTDRKVTNQRRNF